MTASGGFRKMPETSDLNLEVFILAQISLASRTLGRTSASSRQLILSAIQARELEAIPLKREILWNCS